MKKLVTAIMCAAMFLTFQQTTSAEGRLWDREPTLWEAAKAYKLIRPLAMSGQEGPRDASGNPWGKGPQGINMSNGKLKVALSGTGDQLAVTVSKTDTWHRFEAVLPYKPPASRTARERMLAFWNKPFQKPAGQLLLLAEDFKGAPQPDVSSSIHNGINTLKMANGKATGELKYLVTRSDTNIIAISAEFQGLTRPVLARIFRGPGKEGKGDAGNDGSFFWIHYMLPAEKTFPKGFDFYFVAKVAGSSAEI